METEYRASKDHDNRIDLIYEISDVGTAEAATTLGRLFQTESNEELKTEILDALSVMDGAEKERLDVFAVAARPGQPEEVRIQAIEELGDLDDPRAIPVLKELLNDPSEEVRDAVKDALEMLELSL